MSLGRAGFSNNSAAGVGNWIAFTPVIGSTAAGLVFTDLLVLGDGTKTGFYRKVGDSIDVRIFLRWGTTTSLAAGFYWFQLPGSATIDNTKLTTDSELYFNTAFYHDAGAGVRTGGVGMWTVDLTKVQVFINNSASTYTTPSTISSTVPAAPANGDEIMLSIFGLPVTGI